MDADGITTAALTEALVGPTSEIIEDYPDDPRGHSHLVLCQVELENPLHVCCAMHENEVIIITVYVPNPEKWSDDWRTRL